MIGKIFKYTFFGGLIISLISIMFPSNASINDYMGGYAIPGNVNNYVDDTIKDVVLPYPIPEDNINPTQNKDKSPLYGENPTDVQTEIIYDPETDTYIFVKKVGDEIIETPFSVSFEEYLKYDFDNAMTKYWRQR
ncbi:MAG: hypothetical protein PHE33_10375, partial [Bacteroidales bacterium]|nr:hypothetical protein [Bacteroidales bacterium]